MEGLRHRYTIEVSKDGTAWNKVIDKSKSFKDTPNAYILLDQPVTGKFIRYKNIEVPGNNLALSEIRVFGKGHGEIPDKVDNFQISRMEDRRNISFKWDKVKGAQGYNIRWGIAPDKMYQSWLIYDVNEHFMRCLDRDTPYCFIIEAFNENGISLQTPVMKVP